MMKIISIDRESKADQGYNQKRKYFAKELPRNYYKNIFKNFEILLLNRKFPEAPIFSFYRCISLHYEFHNWLYFNIIMDNQVLKAIDHIKYVSKKNPCTLKIFDYV